MYGCESWTIKKAECQRIDAFELWHWKRLLGVPWTARRSSQSILKEISPGCSLEWLMLKLKLQYFGHLMRRTDSLRKEPDAGKDWRWEEKGTTEDEMIGWHHQLSGHGFGGLRELVMDREAWSAVVHGVTKSWTWATELNWKIYANNSTKKGKGSHLSWRNSHFTKSQSSYKVLQICIPTVPISFVTSSPSILTHCSLCSNHTNQLGYS